MTAVIEDPESSTAVAAPAARRGSAARTRGGLVSLVVLAILLGAGLGAYASRAITDYPVARYRLDPSASAWMESGSPGPTASFRAMPVLASDPVSATLWIDARDTFRMWVNGRAVASNRADARVGATPLAASVDVRSLMKAGRNVLAVDVAALGNDTAAVWTRLDLRFADGSTSRIDPTSDLWLTTADVGKTGSALGMQPAYVLNDFSTAGWNRPRMISSVRPVHVDVPADVISPLATPAALQAVTVSEGTATYRLKVTVPHSSDAWLRVAATGAATVWVNGTHITDRPTPGYVSTNSHRPTPLWLIHIGDRLHTGENEIAVRVGAEKTSALSVNTIVLADTGWEIAQPAAQTWTADTATRTGAPLTLGVSTATSAFPNGFTANLVPETGTAVPWLGLGIGAAVGLLVALALLVGTRRPAAATSADAPTPVHRVDLAATRLGRVVMTLLPGVAVICAALVIGRWVTATPGLAYRPVVLLLALLAVLVGPAAGAVVGVVQDRRERSGHISWSDKADAKQTSDSDPADGETTEHAAPAGRRSLRSRVEAGLARLLWLTPARGGIIAVAVASTVGQAWRLGRQPLWQDEATSLVVARAIKAHGLPRLESGLYYFKAELYHGLIAGLLTVTDSTTAIRAVSVLWFAGTVLVFGLMLMPLLTSNPWLQVGATALLVVVPAELAWARDVRMYQQMQFFSVVFLALFLRALRDGKRRDIVWSAVALLAMYLSHEESFVMLPAVPLLLLLSWKTVRPNLRTYLLAYIPALVVVLAQYAISHIHPIDFGDDLSNRPYVGWDPQQADFYYQKVFFAPLSSASLAVLSTLALVGTAVAVRRKERTPALLGLLLVITIATTSLLFTAKVDRYSFIVMPALVGLAVLGAAAIARTVARLCRDSRRATDGQPVAGPPVWVRWTGAVTAAVLTLATIATLAVSPRAYGLWAADATGVGNPLTHSDYQPTVAALKAAVQPGDAVITLSPPVLTELYLGRRPDRVIQTGRNKLLYLVLRDGYAVDTVLGVRVVLTGEDLRTFVESHRRVWMVSDTGSNLQGVPPDVQDQLRADFHVVFQNATTTVSLWDVG